LTRGRIDGGVLEPHASERAPAVGACVGQADDLRGGQVAEHILHALVHAVDIWHTAAEGYAGSDGLLLGRWAWIRLEYTTVGGSAANNGVTSNADGDACNQREPTANGSDVRTGLLLFHTPLSIPG
jgi:hypothetical protein